jgi:hypothetical protein
LLKRLKLINPSVQASTGFYGRKECSSVFF